MSASIVSDLIHFSLFDSNIVEADHILLSYFCTPLHSPTVEAVEHPILPVFDIDSVLVPTGI